MKVDTAEVRRIAALSRIRLTEAEETAMRAHLEVVLRQFSVIGSVDTEAVAPTAHILPAANVLREDEAQAPTAREVLLACAPKADGECFIVPAVIE
ncbi:MAG: Asp-tRNA(Asn)/Glu-tRNA(Gln) amidotransferase subunit GatC [Clostridiales bacterium]|nr:Asp-tRNA(Asn)/Glu-tRNA(Gln) amidotransferase subunit GatC [Clostridiales bacterium]